MPKRERRHGDERRGVAGRTEGRRGEEAGLGEREGGTGAGWRGGRRRTEGLPHFSPRTSAGCLAGETCGCAGGGAARPAGPRGGGSPLSRLSLCPPQRHGLAVCLALTTMCTSLLLMYGGIGIGGGHPEPRRRQQQVAAVPSRPPERGQRHPALPVGAGLLEGYISVLQHKVSRRPWDLPSLPAPLGGHRPRTSRALPPAPREMPGSPRRGRRALPASLSGLAYTASGCPRAGITGVRSRAPARGCVLVQGCFSSHLHSRRGGGGVKCSVSNVVWSRYSTDVCLWWY